MLATEGEESLARMGLSISNPLALMPASPGPADTHPATVYLARLAPGSRRTMAEAFDDVARTLTAGPLDAPVSQLRYQRVRAVRAALAERLARTSVKKALLPCGPP